MGGLAGWEVSVRYRIVIAVLVVGFALQTAETNAQNSLVELVSDRQALMFEMQAAYWPLFELNNGKRTDLEVVSESAQQIAAALDQLPAMFPSGTARGETPGSRATPEIWSAPDEFAAAIAALKDALAKLETVAAGGNIDAFKAQFAEVTTACIACHSFRPSGGGKFRFARE